MCMQTLILLFVSPASVLKLCVDLDNNEDWDNWVGDDEWDDEGPHCDDPEFNV